MALSDPIADLLTRIRNGLRAGHRYVQVGHSKMKQSVLEELQRSGFIEGILVKQDNTRGTIRIYLKYGSGRRSVIHQLKRISKPGNRVYVGHKEIPRVLGGMGIAILSTPKGVMNGKAARDQNLGGEVLAYVW